MTSLDPASVGLTLTSPDHRQCWANTDLTWPPPSVGLTLTSPDPTERCADDTVRHSSTDPDAKVHSIDELVWKRLRPASVGELPGLYAKLAKSKLTSFIVLTSMAGYAMAPAAFDPVTFLLVSVGTTLTCASANAVNQVRGCMGCKGDVANAIIESVGCIV